MTSQQIIELMGLVPLPEEGGYYKETYRCLEEIPANEKRTSKRSACTAIYYLVTPDEFSGLHKVSSDEMFHFYLGDAVQMIQISPEGKLSKLVLGQAISDGQLLQTTVLAGTWQGTKLLNDDGWALLGCTVSPGFEFEDFEVGKRRELTLKYPEHQTVIEAFTRS